MLQKIIVVMVSSFADHMEVVKVPIMQIKSEKV